jgi:hypothetical protein
MITDQTYRELAKEQYHRDGEIEIDPDAPVSRSAYDSCERDDGAYVQAWVWVDNPEPQAGEDL